MPYLKKDGKITTQVNATVPQELFKSCQRILEKRKMSVADFVREQYFANFSLPPILFNVFSPSFSLAGLSQHGDPFHHSHQCSSRLPDHESETIESKRAPIDGSGSLFHRGEVHPEQSDPDVLEEEGDDCIQVAKHGVPRACSGFRLVAHPV